MILPAINDSDKNNKIKYKFDFSPHFLDDEHRMLSEKISNDILEFSRKSMNTFADFYEKELSDFIIEHHNFRENLVMSRYFFTYEHDLKLYTLANGWGILFREKNPLSIEFGSKNLNFVLEAGTLDPDKCYDFLDRVCIRDVNTVVFFDRENDDCYGIDEKNEAYFDDFLKRKKEKLDVFLSKFRTGASYSYSPTEED